MIFLRYLINNCIVIEFFLSNYDMLYLYRKLRKTSRAHQKSPRWNWLFLCAGDFKYDSRLIAF